MKSIILLVMQVSCIIRLAAQYEGPHSPSTFQNRNLPGYDQQWSNTANAAVSDNNYASFGNLAGIGGHTDYLVATNFGFNIPEGTTITGIQVEVECSDPNSLTSDYSVRLLSQGVITGAERAKGTRYPVSDDYMVYGGSGDLWDIPWMNKLIIDEGFGVAIAAQRNSGDPAPTAGRINSIRVTVYFTYMTLPVTLTSFTATKAGTAVRLNWKTSSETNMDRYEIERSSNGANFTSIASVQSQNMATEYHYNDNNPFQGISYYRLKMKELTGNQKYSPVVAVSFARDNIAFLYPSPWEKGAALHISNMNSEKLTIYFMNAGGQILSTAVTETGLVPTGTLMNMKGVVYYKVINQSKYQLGSGSLLIQ